MRSRRSGFGSFRTPATRTPRRRPPAKARVPGRAVSRRRVRRRGRRQRDGGLRRAPRLDLPPRRRSRVPRSGFCESADGRSGSAAPEDRLPKGKPAGARRKQRGRIVLRGARLRRRRPRQHWGSGSYERRGQNRYRIDICPRLYAHGQARHDSSGGRMRRREGSAATIGPRWSSYWKCDSVSDRFASQIAPGTPPIEIRSRDSQGQTSCLRRIHRQQFRVAESLSGNSF